mmetsp:Transcript_579/g.1380  ORF Transcript_579/g.1380 Transcript_579/m.1380 type:complete len:92 (-) Transcript_579:831-1106(-)
MGPLAVYPVNPWRRSVTIAVRVSFEDAPVIRYSWPSTCMIGEDAIVDVSPLFRGSKAPMRCGDFLRIEQRKQPNRVHAIQTRGGATCASGT